METIQTQIAIVGGGPAGLATAHALAEAGYATLILEKGAIAAHIARYPIHMTFFSTSDLLELGGFPLIITGEKPTRREYLNYLRRFVREKGLDVRTGYEIFGLEGEAGDFRLRGRSRFEEEFEVRAETVILATGAYATPQMLGVPGEDRAKVSHYYSEAHPYFDSKVLIVGGRNSAVETALELWRSGAEVTICHRAAEFGTLKYWLKPDIENRIEAGEIKAYRPGRVLEIRPRSVVLENGGAGPVEIENDYVLALTGYRPDPDFLTRMGVGVDANTGRPISDAATLQSERKGVYLVGVMRAGNVSSEIFIENSRDHGELIVRHLQNGASAGGGR